MAPPTKESTAEPELGYEAASSELDVILAELDDETIDIDHLAERVRRAAELVASCRRRIAAARLDVETVVATLQDVLPVERE